MNPTAVTGNYLSVKLYLLQTVRGGHSRHAKPAASQAEFPEIGFLFLLNPELDNTLHTELDRSPVFLLEAHWTGSPAVPPLLHSLTVCERYVPKGLTHTDVHKYSSFCQPQSRILSITDGTGSSFRHRGCLLRFPALLTFTAGSQV